ncbi:cobalamin biosynthesis protein [Marinobacter fuscus]|uniref:Cobalamin biosynthesis protein CobD n=1 Tax=Marinobacter fuscus TaxID=2109942 RepID=A0A2T1KUF8_9GAMM|nr:adenosylcobinamide-phosphate synthase CbiB [Marinobacter fuscus]PSF13363.1 cobalamin biosynthesis protein [Marinobacter fuscus]
MTQVDLPAIEPGSLVLNTFLVAVLICAVAVGVDRLAGEPRRLHPLVGFGHWASLLEQALNTRAEERARSLGFGVLATLVAVLPVLSLALAFEYLLTGWLWLMIQVAGVWLAMSLRGLAEHGRAVSTALATGDEARARWAVSQIVSRDANALTEEGIAAAASESMLENGADAVFSSLFWYLLAGLPGVVLHRLINTLDAMWGYRSPRYLYFGRFAARSDDVLNWLPARLTAFTYALLGNTRLALRCWREQAPAWDSPNAGPVMAAGAGALGVQLGGPAPYAGGIKQRSVLGEGAAPSAETIDNALALVNRGVRLWLAVLLVMALVVQGYGWGATA